MKRKDIAKRYVPFEPQMLNEKGQMKKANKMTFMYANVRGLKSKMSCVKDLLAETKPTVVLLTETHLPDNKGIMIDGYSFFGKAREGKTGGGVGICVANEMKAVVSPHHTQRDIEILWISIHRPAHPPIAVGVYYGKQESVGTDEIVEEFHNLTEEILEKKASGEVILCMDANSKIGLMGEPVSRNGRLLKEMVEECELEIMNGKSVCKGVITRQNRKNEAETSAIDFVLSSYEASTWIKSMVIDECGDLRIRSNNESDHNTIMIDMMIESIDLGGNKVTSEWNKRASPEKWEEFRKELEKSEREAWDIMQMSDKSITERYNKWEKLIYKAAIKTIGRTTYKVGKPAQQSEALKNLKKEKLECKKDFEKEKDQVRKGEKLQKYLEKQNEVKDLIDEEEKEKVKEKFEKMISEAGSNGLWREMRNLKIDETPNWMVTKGPNGERILDPEKNKENAATYYEKLYKDDHVPSHPYHHEVKKEIERLSNQEEDGEDELNELSRMPTEKEIDDAIKKKKNKKSTTDWKNWLLKGGGLPMVRLIMPVIVAFWREEVPPLPWNQGYITNVWKGKGDREMLENQRGITVSSSIGTIVEEIINERLLKTIKFTQSQAGGKKGASTTDHIFILRNIMDIAKHEGRSLMISFFDVQKAFDKASMDDMLYVLHKNGFRGKIWRLTKALNKGLTARVRTKAGLSREILRERGGKQGGKLMVPMFAKTMDTLAEDMQEDECLGILIRNHRIASLLFMDDAMTFAEGPVQQQRSLDAVSEFGKKHQIEWGESKCNVMAVGASKTTVKEWKLGEKIIKSCETYKYLGAVISRNGKNDENLEFRIKKAKVAVRAINSSGSNGIMKRIETEFVIKLHEAITVPTLLYDAETWPLNATAIAKLDRFELWAWKSMIGLPITTPTAAVMFCCGAIYPSIRIYVKQLLYLHKILQKGSDHWAPVTLMELQEQNIGWAKQINGLIESWELEENWELIKTKTYKAWKTEVERAAENKNKEKILEDCQNKKRGVVTFKTKTKSIIPFLEDSEYVRKPQSFMKENNKLIARAYIMGRYGMLQCAANYSMGYGSKLCKECGVTDDEDHRINHCKLWSDINLSTSSVKLNFDDIYSNDRTKSLVVIERVLLMWDLGNGKNIMRRGP